MSEVQTEALAEIRRVFASELGIEREIREEHDLMRDLQLDSVGLVTLVVALEDRFRVRLPEEAASEVRTVRELAELVARADHQKGATP
jgi:acyl carrier protein